MRLSLKLFLQTLDQDLDEVLRLLPFLPVLEQLGVFRAASVEPDNLLVVTRKLFAARESLHNIRLTTATITRHFQHPEARCSAFV